MKHILRYTTALFCVVLALTACLPEEPVHKTINMGAGELTNLSSSAASLMCEIEDVLPKYSKIEYGIVYSDNREKVENHKGVKKIEGQGLSENRFTVQLADLKAKQEYFYCSYLRIDEGRMIYGDISSFVTKASYKASFDANGGKGGMEPQHFEEDDNKALTDNAFTREHHEFAGWNTKSDGSGSYYQPGSLYTLSEDVKLFAQWQAYSGMEEGYTYVDLGLSVEWATRNVGAERREAYGDYFAWGETQPKSNYAWDSYQWGIASDLLTKYCIDAAHGKNGATDGKKVLDLSDDVAHVQWQGDWRMPTIAEFNELHSQCTWKWGTQNGMNGFVVKGKNGNTIFLPAAGYKNSNELHQAGARGAYWSSSLDDMQSDYAYSLHLLPGAPEQFRYDRYYGYSVRPVYLTYYCVRFDANQGQGKMDSLLISKKKAKLILPDNAFTREGYVFAGWNTSADGSGTSYTDKQSISISQNTTLYAQWHGTENGHAYVDLGLSVKWATCNIGATTPEDYGDYFAWGETEPKSDYSWETYKYCKGSSNTQTKYCTKSNYGYNGFTDNKTTLELSDDAARVNWGGKWRMPTKAEQDELRNNCTWTWTTQNGIKGYKVTSKSNGNSIFLPAAGCRNGTSINNVGSNGYYWSSSLYESRPYYAYYLYFYSSYVDWDFYSRNDGRTVRAVFSDEDKPSTFVTITFNANGGSGTMSAQTFEAGVAQTLKANTFTRDGYLFAGWNTSADGSGTSYSDKESISISQNTTLYAQWGRDPSMGEENGHEWVDLGLSVKWATCNIGATTPEGYGDYFAWGETSPKSNYDWSTYKYCKGSSDTQTKYCTISYYGYNGFTDNKTTLELSDDAARVNWGGKWRMPTKAERDELRNNCTGTWTIQNGVVGCKVTSKSNGNSIFLPAAGYRNGTSIGNVGSLGYCWSSSLYESHPYNAYDLSFDSHGLSFNFQIRYYGHTVRAVCP